MKKITSFFFTCLTAFTLTILPASARDLFTVPPLMEHLDHMYFEDELLRSGDADDSEEIIFIPEEESPYRAPVITHLSDSLMTGLEQPMLFYPNTYYPFSVSDTIDQIPVPYVQGDVRYRPLYWSTAANPDFEQTHTVWQIGTVAGISEAQTYNLYVWYYREIYNGTEWTAGPLERKVFTFSTQAYSTTTPVTPSLSASSTYKKITLNWENTYLADGYELAVREKGSDSYAVSDIGNVNTYALKSLNTGTPYYIRIRAYHTSEDGKTKTYSAYSPVQKIVPSLKTPSLEAVGKTTAGKVKISWKAVNGADGYQVWARYKTGEDFVKAKGTTGLSAVVLPNDASTLYLRVRAYRTVNGKKVFSAFTTPVKVVLS